MRRALVALALCSLSATVAGTIAGTAAAAPPADGAGRPFRSDSAWNTPVPASPVLDPRSPLMVASLSQGAHPGVANLYEFGVPVWEADAATPRHEVRCLRPWGTCELQAQPVPVPDGAYPSSGSDRAMVVVDHSQRRSYEFFEARDLLGSWTAGWGGVVALDGEGTPGQAVGAAVSRLAGVVRIHEVRRGRIDHALVLSTNNACRGTYRYPAAKSDGSSARPDCVPEGARLQLDPRIDLTALPMTDGERMVARALQTYGAYVIDNGGATMAFIFESPSGESDPYPAVGFSYDYFAMDAVPWRRLRVLREWHGR